MGRVAKEDTGLLSAVREARARHKDAVADAKKKIEAFIASETDAVYRDLIDAVRMALIEGHSARQIGEAYGSSDPYTIKKLVEEAKIGTSIDNGADPSWRVESLDGGTFQVRVVAFGPDRLNGRATFEVDADGENITAIDGDFWLQSALYREGIVKEVLDAR